MSTLSDVVLIVAGQCVGLALAILVVEWWFA